MKKTIITLLALCGVATAADSITTLASVSDYTISSSSFVSFSDETSDWYAFNNQINAATGFTLQITLTSWTPANGPLFYLSTGTTETSALYNTSLVAVGYSNDGNSLSGWHGATLFNTDNGSMGSSNPNVAGKNPGPVTYEYTSNSRTELPSHANSGSLEATLFVTSNNGTVTLYEVDNDSVLTKICSTTNLSEGVAKSIVFAEWPRENGAHSTNGNRATIGITAYKGALTETQMTSLIVPEPTTATLSLLALAGLAARRRRR